MSIFKTSENVLQVTLLVLPESSMMSLASVLDTMRATNRIAGRDLFEWNIATLSGKPARLTSDILIEPDVVLDQQSRGDVLIVIASFNHQHHAGPAHLKLIKRLARNFTAVGGIETGSWILARSGLLEGRSATTHCPSGRSTSAPQSSGRSTRNASANSAWSPPRPAAANCSTWKRHGCARPRNTSARCASFSQSRCSVWCWSRH